MPTCQPQYETRGCKWTAVLRHSVSVRIPSKHVDFNNLPSALLYRGVTTVTFQVLLVSVSVILFARLLRPI